MTVIEKANELGQLIKDCPEMKALTEAEAAQAKDDAAQELIKERIELPLFSRKV